MKTFKLILGTKNAFVSATVIEGNGTYKFNLECEYKCGNQRYCGMPYEKAKNLEEVKRRMLKHGLQFFSQKVFDDMQKKAQKTMLEKLQPQIFMPPFKKINLQFCKICGTPAENEICGYCEYTKK